MKVYITSTVDRQRQAERLRDILISAGHTITYDWMEHGTVRGTDAMRRVAKNQLSVGVRDADVLIALLPGTHRTFAEIGAALVLDKPVILCAEDEETFNSTEIDAAMLYYHARVVARLNDPEPEMLMRLLEGLNRHERVAMFKRAGPLGETDFRR